MIFNLIIFNYIKVEIKIAFNKNYLKDMVYLFKVNNVVA